MKNLHWTKRLLISSIPLVWVWVGALSSPGLHPEGWAIVISLTIAALYWVTKPILNPEP